MGAVALWSTVATAFKLSLEQLSPLQLVSVASMVSWLFFGVLVAMRGELTAIANSPRRDLIIGLAIGAINPGLYYFLLFAAYDRLPAQEAMALNYTWALTLPLLAAPLLRQRLSGHDITAALISYCGVFIIATRGDVLGLKFADPVGVGLAVASTVLWGLCWIANTRHSLTPITSLFMNFSGSTPLLVIALFATDQAALPLSVGLLGGIYVGLFEMGLSFILWLNAMRLTSSSARISTLIFLSPPLSLVFIALVLKEPVRIYTLTGLGFILLGLLLQHWPSKPSMRRV